MDLAVSASPAIEAFAANVGVQPLGGTTPSGQVAGQPAVGGAAGGLTTDARAALIVLLMSEAERQTGERLAVVTDPATGAMQVKTVSQVLPNEAASVLPPLTPEHGQNAETAAALQAVAGTLTTSHPALAAALNAVSSATTPGTVAGAPSPTPSAPAAMTLANAAVSAPNAVPLSTISAIAAGSRPLPGDSVPNTRVSLPALGGAAPPPPRTLQASPAPMSVEAIAGTTAQPQPSRRGGSAPTPVTTPVAPLNAIPSAPLGAAPTAPLGVTPTAPLSTAPLGTTPTAPLGVTPTAPLSTAPLGTTPITPVGAAPTTSLADALNTPIPGTPTLEELLAPTAALTGGAAPSSFETILNGLLGDPSPAAPAAAQAGGSAVAAAAANPVTTASPVLPTINAATPGATLIAPPADPTAPATPDPEPTAPPAATAQPAAAAPKTKSITIKAGDTLYSLAQTYNTTVANLVKLNSIADPNVIKAGSQLKVPA